MVRHYTALMNSTKTGNLFFIRFETGERGVFCYCLGSGPDFWKAPIDNFDNRI